MQWRSKNLELFAFLLSLQAGIVLWLENGHAAASLQELYGIRWENGWFLFSEGYHAHTEHETRTHKHANTRPKSFFGRFFSPLERLLGVTATNTHPHPYTHRAPAKRKGTGRKPRSCCSLLPCPGWPWRSWCPSGGATISVAVCCVGTMIVSFTNWYLMTTTLI